MAKIKKKEDRIQTVCFMNMCMVQDENGNVEKNETFAESMIREEMNVMYGWKKKGMKENFSEMPGIHG